MMTDTTKETTEGTPSAPQSPTISAEPEPQPEAEKPQKSVIERVDALMKHLDETERVLNEKITQFEERLAEKILSGRAEIVPQKSQAEKDREEAEKIIKKYFG